jgi:RloB-like protein
VGRRNRSRRPARRVPYKDSKPVILIVTEGQVAEPEYLKGLARAARNSRVDIEVRGGVGVPRTIVESAKELKRAAEKRARGAKDNNLCYDEVWCVFDFAKHPNIPDAKQMARDNGIEVAVSNPCFELWLWLHFAAQPGMQHRHRLQRTLKQHLPDYDKHLDYSDCAVGYDEAVRRASRLDEDARADNDEGRNPTTGVWRLTESIRSDA